MALALAVVATVVGSHVRSVGAPVVAILLGVAVAHVAHRRRDDLRDAWRPGVSFAASTLLKGSVVVLGLGLSLGDVVRTGVSSLPELLGTLAVALVGTRLLGRRLGVDGDLRTLIGVGTAICGASAIAASDAVIEAAPTDVSYAIATIFTFNVAAVLTFPTLGHLLGLSPHAFGLWSGTAINDMSSVVAASSIYGATALSYAVIVKLTRTLFIVPITVALSYARAAHGGARPRGLASHLAVVRRSFPRFIGWFLLAVTLDSLRLVPAGWHAGCGDLASFLIASAMAGIGLSTNVRDVRRAGAAPLALGAGLWVLVASSSLLLQVLCAKW